MKPHASRKIGKGKLRFLVHHLLGIRGLKGKGDSMSYYVCIVL
jgi:hypothetical protein